MLGLAGEKNIPHEFASDVEINCSLAYNKNQPPYTAVPIAVHLTMDAHNVLRAYLMYNDQCELLFSVPLTFKNPDDYGVSLEFYWRAKAILVSSKMGESIAVTNYLKQWNIFEEGSEDVQVKSLVVASF
jgi:hypothetical protein